MKFSHHSICLTLGDVTKLAVDAVVNSANASLVAGSGVSGAIFKAAGAALSIECAPLAPLDIGSAILTAGYNLPARHVIHTVAPKWYLGNSERAEQLANCYKASFALAEKNQLHSIAFPCIGMGIYRCPLEIGAEIAVKTIVCCLESARCCHEVFLVCATREQEALYTSLLSRYAV